MFWVQSANLHPSVVTKSLRGIPTRIQVKGELAGNGVSLFKKHRWILALNDQSPEHFEAALKKDIFNFIHKRQKKLLEIQRDYECVLGLTVAIHTKKYHIGILFSPEVVRALSDVNGMLDVSIY